MQGNNSILAGLVRVASLFVARMKAKVSSNGLPSKISDSTYIGEAQSNESSSSIEIRIDMSKNGAPMAAAFEWGSGIHRTRGQAGTYPIEGHPLLAIPRSRWPNYEPPPDVDPVILPAVNHPGVAARPYIQPTLEDASFQQEARKILGQSFKEQVLLGVPKETVIEIHVA